MIRRKLSLMLAVLMVISTMTVGLMPITAGSDNGKTTDLSAPYTEDEYEEIRKPKQNGQADPDKTESASIQRESLYTKTIDNGDGTKTLEVYGTPVKYRTEDGSVNDISLKPLSNPSQKAKDLRQETTVSVFPSRKKQTPASAWIPEST